MAINIFNPTIEFWNQVATDGFDRAWLCWETADASYHIWLKTDVKGCVVEPIEAEITKWGKFAKPTLYKKPLNASKKKGDPGFFETRMLNAEKQANSEMIAAAGAAINIHDARVAHANKQAAEISARLAEAKRIGRAKALADRAEHLLEQLLACTACIRSQGIVPMREAEILAAELSDNRLFRVETHAGVYFEWVAPGQKPSRFDAMEVQPGERSL